MKAKAAVVGCLLSGVALGAFGGCGSDDNPTTMNPGSGGSTGSGSGSGGGGGASGGQAGGRDPNKNCVKPGATGNEKGVGAYCVSSADCMSPAGGLLLCSADFGAADTAWFCTTICTTDSDCGSGAVCKSSDKGMGCAPLECVSQPDAGGDGPTGD